MARAPTVFEWSSMVSRLAGPEGFSDAKRPASIRLGTRGSAAAMPPIATHDVEPPGMAVVTAWINGMTKACGYPVPVP
jgi:hypothetical protein